MTDPDRNDTLLQYLGWFITSDDVRSLERFNEFLRSRNIKPTNKRTILRYLKNVDQFLKQ